MRTVVAKGEGVDLRCGEAGLNATTRDLTGVRKNDVGVLFDLVPKWGAQRMNWFPFLAKVHKGGVFTGSLLALLWSFHQTQVGHTYRRILDSA